LFKVDFLNRTFVHNKLFSNKNRKMNLVPNVVVHPTVLFSIVDAYERRPEEARRVIGTLLGSVEKGGYHVEVTNCFAVPHNESEDEVAVDMEFAKNMFDLHKKVQPNEVIVGWYATGPDVTEHSVLIHEYYSREAKNPVHLTLDTTLRGNHMGLKAFQSTALGVAGKTVGTLFSPLKVSVRADSTEKVGLSLLGKTTNTPKKPITLPHNLDQIDDAAGKMEQELAKVTAYVEEVLNGKRPADAEIGRHLLELTNSVPQMDSTEIDTLLTSHMNDLLMVTYLSNLIKTQLHLNEKLTTVL